MSQNAALPAEPLSAEAPAGGEPPAPDAAPALGRSSSSRPLRIVGSIVGITLAIGIAGGGLLLLDAYGHGTPAVTEPPADAAGAATTEVAKAGWSRPVVTEADLADRLGVRIVAVSVSGGGGLLDLRFQVVDPDKAAAVHDVDTPPAVVETTTGLVAKDLLMGHAHSGDYTAGQTYYLIFENPGNLIQGGGMVSVLLGNTEVDNVAVR